MRTRRTSSAPAKYEALVRLFPLRPLRDDVDLENARELMDALAVLDEPTQDQSDYLHVLGNLIDEYEQTRSAAVPKLPPIDALRFLMRLHGMSASDLGRLLGQRQLGSRILCGTRKLSKTHIRTLADHFRVSADLFLD